MGTVPDPTGGDPLGLHPELEDRLHSELLALDVNPHVSPALAGFGLELFVPVSYEHYAPEEQALQECERLLGNRLSGSGSLLHASGRQSMFDEYRAMVWMLLGRPRRFG
jgi:hypothetical protein